MKRSGMLQEKPLKMMGKLRISIFKILKKKRFSMAALSTFIQNIFHTRSDEYYN